MNWLSGVDTGLIVNQHYWSRYASFISSRVGRAPPVGYTERHHAWPLSLGGSNESWNLVSLSAREHFIAHWMLWKAVGGKNMAFAFWTMYNTSGAKRSRTYSALREEVSIALRQQRLGIPLTEETKAKQSISLKGLLVGDRNGMYGKPLKEEHKAKMSSSLTGLLVGDKNPMFGMNPWRMSLSEDSLRTWSSAGELFSSWIRCGKKGVVLTCREHGGFSHTMSTENVVAKFKKGWVPSEDLDWINWKESI